MVFSKKKKKIIKISLSCAIASIVLSQPPSLASRVQVKATCTKRFNPTSCSTFPITANQYLISQNPPHQKTPYLPICSHSSVRDFQSHSLTCLSVYHFIKPPKCIFPYWAAFHFWSGPLW